MLNANIAVGSVVMEQVEFDRVVEELTLLLIYLTSWREEVAPGGPGIQRTWKTLQFKVLDALAKQGLIETNHRSKSLRITEAGLLKAEELRNKHLKG